MRKVKCVRRWRATVTDIIPSGPFKSTATGLRLPRGKVPYQKWEEYGQALRWIQRSLRWAIGDWLNYGKRTYGQMYSQAIEIFPEYSQSSLEKCAYVSDAYPYDTRRSAVGWTLHAEVAKLPPAEREQWLDELELGMTRHDLRLALKDGNVREHRPHCPTCTCAPH